MKKQPTKTKATKPVSDEIPPLPMLPDKIVAQIEAMMNDPQFLLKEIEYSHSLTFFDGEGNPQSIDIRF